MAKGGREPPRDSGPLGLKEPRPSGGDRQGLQAALRSPGGLECMSRRDPTGRRGASAPGALPSPAAVARETRSRRRKELTHLGAPHASLVRTQSAARVGGPGEAEVPAAETPAPGLRRPESATTAVGGRGSFKAEGSGPSCGPRFPARKVTWLHTFDCAGAAFWGRGWLGRVPRGWSSGTCARASRRGGRRLRCVPRAPAGGRTDGRAAVEAARLWRESSPRLPRLPSRAARGEDPACMWRPGPVIFSSVQVRARCTSWGVGWGSGCGVRSGLAAGGSWLGRPGWGRGAWTGDRPLTFGCPTRRRSPGFFPKRALRVLRSPLTL